MSSLVPLSEVDTRELRWPPALTVLPYGMLAFCVALTVVIEGGHSDPIHKTVHVDCKDGRQK